MTVLTPFQPVTTTVIAATTTSQNVAVDAASAYDIARIAVVGANVRIKLTSNGTDTAGASDMLVMGGSVELFRKARATNIAVVSDSTSTVYVTTGLGDC